MLNLYWPVYKNIENEVLDLTRNIHFCDEQINTFSTRISDLLLRISVEVESISKELFNTQFEVGDKFYGGKDHNVEICYYDDGEWRKENKNGVKSIQNLYFDYNCLKYLDEQWKLKERKVQINASNMFFKKSENVVLFPLSDHALTEGASPNERGGWLKAYQAIKHSRMKSQHFGSIYHMIHALGALYILNIYYFYTKHNLLIVNDLANDRVFDKTCGSTIFTTTIGQSRSDIFVSQFNGIIELNVNQKVSYIDFDSEGYPIFDGVHVVTFDDGTVDEINVPFERDQK